MNVAQLINMLMNVQPDLPVSIISMGTYNSDLKVGFSDSTCFIADELSNKEYKVNNIKCKDVIINLAEVLGIKKHANGNYVHPVVGIVEGIEDCESFNEIVVKLIIASKKSTCFDKSKCMCVCDQNNGQNNVLNNLLEVFLKSHFAYDEKDITDKPTGKKLYASNDSSDELSGFAYNMLEKHFGRDNLINMLISERGEEK